MATYSFHSIELKDLDGKKVPNANVHKVLANALYAQTKDLDLVEKARDINQAKQVELDKTEIEEVKRVIEDPQTGFMAFAKKAILDFIESVK